MYLAGRIYFIYTDYDVRDWNPRLVAWVAGPSTIELDSEGIMMFGRKTNL